MAITTTQQTSIMKASSALFNKAFSPEMVTDFVSFYESNGNDLAKLADALIGSSVYTAQYAGAATVAEYATILMGHYGLSYTGTTAADTNMKDFIEYSFANKASWATSLQTIQAVDKYLTATFIPSLTTTDTVWGTMAQAVENKATAATTFKNNPANAGTELSLVSVTSDVATITTATTTAVVGGTFALTVGTDIINTTTTVAANKTTANNDTIYATTADSFDTDIIDGGAGTDSIIASYTANDNTITPTSVTNVENITATVTAADTKTFTFDAANITGVETFTLKNAGAVSHGAGADDETITVSNLAKTTTLGILGGTASTGATGSVISATFASAAATDTQKVAISTLGKTASLTLATATTVEITATGNGTTGANAIGLLTNTAMDKLNIKGSGDITISDIATSTATATGLTIDASTNTGKVSVTGESAIKMVFTGNNNDTVVTAVGGAADNITTGSGNDTITLGTAAAERVVAGAGNDTVVIGATTDITADDSINGGDGVDTLSTTDATLNATDKTALALGTSNFEVLNSSAATLISVDFNALSTFNTVSSSAAMAAAYAGVQGTVGDNSLTITKMENTDYLVISAARAGESSGVDVGTVNTAAANTAGAVGGNGINISVLLDNGSNIANLKLVGNADISGGAGETSNGTQAAGNGGIALNASEVESLNIEIASTMAQNAGGTLTIADGDVVTFAGGAAGATNGGVAGSAGSTVVVGSNATINLTSSYGTVAATGLTAQIHSSVNLGTIVGANVTLNGSAFEGNITATSGSGNTTLTGGNGKDTLTGAAGQDTISGGANNDIIDGKAGADMLSGGTGRDTFEVSTNTDSIVASYDKISDFGVIGTAITATNVTAMNSGAAFQATATAAGASTMDALILADTSALEAAEAVDVAGAATGAVTATGNLTAKGILTISGADAALFDTLAEWVDAAEIMLDTAADVLAFEFNGNTYVFQNQAADANDQLVELTGVTGVTGIIIGGSAVAGLATDIFVI